MRRSLMSVIFAVALFLECYAVAVALPMGQTDDGSLERDTFVSLLSNEASESALIDGDPAAAGKTRGQRVIVIADPSPWRDLRGLHSGLTVYKRRADDNGQDPNIPILRRDTMRCMVGRVYRPCWEV
ncbi:uncharacterized protein ACO6RY_06352 [Pungitius sinensis]